MSNVAFNNMMVSRHLHRLSSWECVLSRRQGASQTPVRKVFQHSQHSPNSIKDMPPLVKSFQDLPTSNGYPLLGTLPEFLAAGGVQQQHKYVTQRHLELGSIFREKLGGMELVFVSDPGAISEVFKAEGQYPKHFIPEAWLLYNKEREIRRGLFFMEGEEWRKCRSILNRRLLRPGSLVPHLPALSQVADTVVERWIAFSSSGPIPDLERELYRWSIESLGVIAFGSRLGLLGEVNNNIEKQCQEDMRKFIEAIHCIFKETSALGTIPPVLARSFRLPVWKRLTGCLDDALRYGRTLVSAGLRASLEGMVNNQDPHTLLEQLLHDDHLHESDILCLLPDLFLAAADTTSHTTIWSLYLLGRHPEVVLRARQEVLEVTGGTGKVNGEHIASLSYLKGVVKEALRMYPVAPFQVRILDRSANLGGYHVPAGTMVVISVYTMGRDPMIFQNPDCFTPERWLRNTSSSGAQILGTSVCPTNDSPRLHSHAFIPFGVGGRSCIGKRIAETQLYLLLAKLVAKTNLRALNQVEMVLRMVGVTSQPLQLQVDSLRKST